MRNSVILLQNDPKGVFLEGTISGSNIYPGTWMQMVAGVSADGSGEMEWGVYESASGADGDPRLCAILLEDDLQGFLYSTPYVSGTRCKMYCPLPGDQMNVRIAGEAGTGSANAFTVGERLIPQHATGLMIAEVTSSVVASFMSMEHLDEVPDTATWLWVMKQ